MSQPSTEALFAFFAPDHGDGKSAPKERRDRNAPPGENCNAARGRYFPVIDRNRCEGKAACVRVCPHDVFEVRTIDGEDWDQLSFLGRIRSAVHGRKSAYTPNASHCQACGLCVVACPEKAISLVVL